MYARTLDKDYLINILHIVEVSEDGSRIVVTKKGKNKVAKQFKNNCGYQVINVYDNTIRKATPKEERTNATGQFMLGVHRIVYAWYNDNIEYGMVIDHKDNNKSNNYYTNLIKVTPSENLCKGTDKNTRLLKCKLNVSRDYYENELVHCKFKYELAKLNKDAKAAHKWRSYIANINAKLRYYDLNIKNY